MKSDFDNSLALSLIKDTLEFVMPLNTIGLQYISLKACTM